MTWQAATPGQATLVGHVNQLLTTHAAVFTYNGAAIGTDPTLTSFVTEMGSTSLAQSFTLAAPTTLGHVDLALGAVGAGQDVLVTLQADSGGAPSGVPLVGCVVPPEWLPLGVASGPSLFAVPLPQALAAGTYWIVLQPGSSLLASGFSQALAGTDDVQLTQSTATSGGSIYTGGAWVAQTFGFGVYLRDNTGNELRAIADDAIPGLSYPVPAKVTAYAYSAGVLTHAFEWVARSLNVTPNLLCRDDASYEVSTGSAADVANASFARSNAHALDGTWSLKMTAAALGNMTVEVGPYPVVAGDTYSWTAAFLDGGSHESAQAIVAWYDGATLVSTSPGGNVTTSQTAWGASTGTAVAPATTTVAYLQFTVSSAPAASVFYVDEGGILPGPSAVWSYPGLGVATARTLTYSSGELVSAT